MKNPISDNINNLIRKAELKVKYYHTKANDGTYLRDGKVYINNEEWRKYWLDTAAYWEAEVTEYYEVLRYVHKKSLGELPYPVSPSHRVEA